LSDEGEFEWDEYNLSHIAPHGVTPGEIREVVEGRHVVAGPVEINSEDRWILYGKTRAGRYLVVVYTVRNNRIRVVTAHTMHKSQRRKYAAEID